MYYAAWNSIKTLLNHDLVYASSSRNATYQLTDLGREISERLFQLHNESEKQVSAAATESSSSQNQWRSPPSSPQRATISTILSQALQRAPSSTTAASPVTPKTSEDRLYKVTTWPAGSYRIKIVFDNREVKSTNDRRFFEMEVLNYGVASEVKSLAVGDVVWIAEHKRTEQQVVIDYIAERKRLDDLISSIKDGRFSEQKFRLHRSSLKNIIYLVEESLVMEVTAAFKKAVHTAMSQAIIVDGFFLKRTLSAEETAKYLANVTQYLEFLYKDRALTVIKPDVSNYKQAMTKAREMFNKYHIGIDYEAFATAMSKTGMLTVRDVFIKMLMTIRGVTWDKAVTVQKLYKTPYFLCQAYREMNDEQKRKTLLSDQTASLIARKKITKVISERIYETWGELINQP
jgi:crossover junction endonuclease MUS81